MAILRFLLPFTSPRRSFGTGRLRRSGDWALPSRTLPAQCLTEPIPQLADALPKILLSCREARGATF
ncbi:MAG: hypothetical protein LBT40_00435 [Deltaproteobacteria bacterium]|nr:hypothetical protein [Deltaproteobacteria bacterium]